MTDTHRCRLALLIDVLALLALPTTLVALTAKEERPGHHHRHDEGSSCALLPGQSCTRQGIASAIAEPKSEMMEDPTSIESADVDTYSFLQVSTRAIKITVLTLYGKKITLFVESNDTINNLKAKIEDSEGIQRKWQILIYQNKPMQDDRLITDYNIRAGSVVRLVLNNGLCLKWTQGVLSLLTSNSHGDALKRIQMELADLEKHPLANIATGPSADDYFFWQATFIAPKGSPYEGGIFFLDIKISHAYPLDPPKVKFTTKIYSCYVNDQGAIHKGAIESLCSWSPSTFIKDVLLDIYKEVFVNIYCDPFDSAKAREWVQKYAK